MPERCNRADRTRRRHLLALPLLLSTASACTMGPSNGPMASPAERAVVLQAPSVIVDDKGTRTRTTPAPSSTLERAARADKAASEQASSETPAQVSNSESPRASDEPATALARTIQVGPQGTVRTIAEAAKIARDGDTVEVAAGTYRGDVALWRQKRLTIRAVGGRAVIHADGQSAEGKGIWVLRDGEFVIDGFDFIGARVPDGNGAGIRFERGRLTVRNSRFIDNQMGLLTGNDPGSELTIERCEFSGPTDGPRHYHNVYAGAIARFTMTASWSHSARVGHLVKTRARESVVSYNRFTDETGTASYELEFPNGGDALVVGNLIEQSARTDNETIVSFGAEGYRWPQNRLRMSHNTLVDRARNGRFLAVRAGADEVMLARNLWVGPGSLQPPAGARVMGNLRTDEQAFRNPRQYDFVPTSMSALVGGTPQPEDAGAELPRELRPTRQYSHPRSTDRVGDASLPGAFQR